MITINSFKYFKILPENIKLAVMYYGRFPLNSRWVEDILHERGIYLCHETVRFWWNRFIPLSAKEIRHHRAGHHSNGVGTLMKFSSKINGERYYLWWAVDHEGTVLESDVSKRHGLIYNHFNHEMHLETRQVYKQKRAAALTEWREICAA